MITDTELSLRGTKSRPDHENPLSPTCKLHLRRICGTCAHFTGALRQNAFSHCTIYRAPRHPIKSAARCAHWTRKG